MRTQFALRSTQSLLWSGEEATRRTARVVTLLAAGFTGCGTVETVSKGIEDRILSETIAHQEPVASEQTVMWRLDQELLLIRVDEQIFCSGEKQQRWQKIETIEKRVPEAQSDSEGKLLWAGALVGLIGCGAIAYAPFTEVPLQYAGVGAGVAVCGWGAAAFGFPLTGTSTRLADSGTRRVPFEHVACERRPYHGPLNIGVGLVGSRVHTNADGVASVSHADLAGTTAVVSVDGGNNLYEVPLTLQDEGS